MSLFYKPSAKKLLEARNTLFLKTGGVALAQQGFQHTPYSSAWFGRNNLGDYMYDWCRVTTASQLEVVSVYISRGDRWIKIFLNVFALHPPVHSIEQLRGLDGMAFHLPPASMTRMRLRDDDRRGVPLFYLFSKEHKVGAYWTQQGFEQRLEELRNLLAEDLNHVDRYIKRWHELHKPLMVDWDGEGVTR